MQTVRFKQKPNHHAAAFYVSRSDFGMPLQAKLDVETTGYTIKIEGTKPSGATYSEVCTATEYGCLIPVTEQMTDEPGLTKAQLVLIGSDVERMGSEQVQIWVEPLGGVA